MNAGDAINEVVEQQRKELQNAIRRRNRAAAALDKADRDIAAVSGALAALESVYRKLYTEEEAGAEAEPAAPVTEVKTYQTLGGVVALNSY